MQEGFRPELYLERKDNDLGYFKSNCIWATQFQQTLNRECSHRVKVGKKEIPLRDWCKQNGMTYNGFMLRVWKKGLTVEEALYPKHDLKFNQQVRHKVEIEGETMSFAEACRRFNVPYEKSLARLKRGKPYQEILGIKL